MEMKNYPDCGATLPSPDSEGWQMCDECGSDFGPDYDPETDYDDE